MLACLCLLFTTPCVAVAQDAVPRSIAGVSEEMTARFSGIRATAWGEAIPGITRSLAAVPSVQATGVENGFAVFLTLDACGGDTDMRIISLVRELRIPVTLFVTNRWLARNTRLARELARDPLFLFAAHGARHKPASVTGRCAFGVKGTASVAELVREVEENAESIQALTGTRPAWFRAGTAHYDAVAVAVIHALGFSIAGYTVNADAGATLTAPAVAQRVRTAGNGAIILAHANRPQSGTAEGLARGLPALLKAGARFAHLPMMPE